MGRLTDEELNTYQRDGFLAMNSLIDRQEVTHLRTVLMDLHERNVGFEEGAQFDAVGLDDGTQLRRFPQIMHPRVFAPEIATTGFHTVAFEIAKQILGEGARLKADISLLKPARIGSETAWHQDEAFGNPRFVFNEVSIWLALTTAHHENSCMSFVPGSHEIEVLPHRPLGGDPRIHTLECVGDFNPTQAVECPLEAGGCTIHHQRTLHYAGANTSDQDRLAYVLIFDTSPLPRADLREFPWSKAHVTARTQREQKWRRHGGILIHAWRQRHRLRLDRIAADFRRAVYAIRDLAHR